MSLLEGSKGPADAPGFFSWLLRVGLVSALPPGLVSPSAKVTFRSRLGDLTFGEITGCSPGVPMASRFCPLKDALLQNYMVAFLLELKRSCGRGR
jgi:hypothetical protein